MTETDKTPPEGIEQGTDEPTSSKQAVEKASPRKKQATPRASTLATFAARAGEPRKSGPKSPLAALIAKAAGEIDDDGENPAAEPGK